VTSPSNPTLRVDGPLERAAFPPLLSAFVGLVVAFLLFQGISAVVLIGVAMQSGMTVQALITPDGLNNFLSENADKVIWANTIGQVFGLLLPGLLFARWHSSTVRAFVRLRPAAPRHLLLAALGLLGLIPWVHFAAGLFDSLPWPEWVRSLEEGQMALIEQVLTQDFSLVFAISMLALTPAICEEVFFRGFIQRQAERSLGALGGILFSGIIFGLYHLRLTQAVPLSLLGIFMAWLTWQTRSLWPAILVHLINNALAAVLGKLANGSDTLTEMETLPVPWWVLVLSAALLSVSVYSLIKQSDPDSGGARVLDMETGSD